MSEQDAARVEQGDSKVVRITSEVVNEIGVEEFRELENGNVLIEESHSGRPFTMYMFAKDWYKIMKMMEKRQMIDEGGES